MTYSRRQLEAFGEPFGDSATQYKLGGRIYGGGGSSAPSNQTVTQTSIPDYFKPYAEKMIGKAEAVSNQEYQPYQGERQAGFTPLQQQAFTGVSNMQTAGQLGTATDYAKKAGLLALQNSQYQGGGYQNRFQAPQSYQAGAFNPGNVSAPDLEKYQMQAPEQVQAAQMQAANLGMSPTAQAAQSNFDPRLQQYQMQAPERVQADSFLQDGNADSYMSPYMEKVIAANKREAIRDADIQRTTDSARAVQAGAFGGSRQAIVDAERERNLGTRLSDIQNKGMESAYTNAQGQFNAEQQARLQANLANQQAGMNANIQNLNALLGVQQLGTNTGLQQALTNAQLGNQVNLANQALAGQYGLQQGQFDQAANLNNMQALNNMNQFNSTMGFNTGQQNLNALLNVQQLGSGQNMQSQLANQQYGLEAQRLNEQSRQFGYGQDMTAAQLAAQYGLSADQLNENSNQFGANLGMQGINALNNTASTLGNLGQTEFGQNKDIIQGQMSAGSQQQQAEQKRLDQLYQDFLNQRDWEKNNIAWFSDLTRGLPMAQYAQMSYQAPPSMLSQFIGGGTALYGAGRMGGYFAEGGEVEADEAPAGLAELALHNIMRGKK